jgi:hypothetical protein
LNRNNNQNKYTSGKSRRRFYPRHTILKGQPYLARATAIKHVPAEKTAGFSNTYDSYDDIKVGDLVIFGDKECIPIYISGEKYFIAYRNKLVKIKG